MHAQAEATALRLLIEGPPPFGEPGDGTPALRGAAWATLLDALAVAEFTRSFFTQLESAPLSAAEVSTGSAAGCLAHWCIRPSTSHLCG